MSHSSNMKKYKFVVSISYTTEAESRTSAEAQIYAIMDTMGFKGVRMALEEETRSERQNNALHLFFSQLADELNEKGLDMRTIIRSEVEISWTPYTIKEYLWKPLQKIITGKKSTTKLDKMQEINKVYDNLNRILVERTQGEVQIPPFPSIEELMTH